MGCPHGGRTWVLKTYGISTCLAESRTFWKGRTKVWRFTMHDAPTIIPDRSERMWKDSRNCITEKKSGVKKPSPF